MERHVKRRVLIASTALGLAGAVGGSALAVEQSSEPGTARSGVRAQEAHYKHDQTSDDPGTEPSTAPSNDPVATPSPTAPVPPADPPAAPPAEPPAVPAPANLAPVGNAQIHVKVMNYAPFYGEVCVTNSEEVKGPDAKPDDPMPNCIGVTDGRLSDFTVHIKDKGTVADVHGDAYWGDSADLHVPVKLGELTTDCFRFDGTTHAGFKFSQVDCSDFKTPVK